MFYFGKDDKTYGVRFEREGTTTLAWLIRVDKVEGLVDTGLVGIAQLHPSDNMVKKVGRKLALARLLHRMTEISAGDIEPEFVLTKEDRENIWAEYFKNHKK